MRTLENMELALVRGALDSLGVALADKTHSWTDGERTIYEQAVSLLEPDPHEAVCDELLDRRRIGAMLANCAYNLAQRETLNDNDRNVLTELRKAWDAVKSA